MLEQEAAREPLFVSVNVCRYSVGAILLVCPHLVDEPRLENLGNLEENAVLGDEYAFDLRKREQAQNLCPVHSLLVSLDPVFRNEFEIVRVEHVRGKRVSDNRAVCVRAQSFHVREPLLFPLLESAPVVDHPLERAGDIPVI